MFADTAAIHELGAAAAHHASNLEAIAATLTAAHGMLASGALGPVGAGFVAALDAAVTREADAIARLSERVAAAGATAHATGTAYVATETAGSQGLSGFGG